MKNKKGSIDIQTYALFSLIVAVLLIIIIVLKAPIFSDILLPDKASCSNSKSWDGSNGLKEILKDLDSGAPSSQFLFYNNDCNIVSFSLRQVGNEIPYPGVQPREATICLCDIDRNIITGNVECDPYDCYKFKNFDEVNSEQFSTEDLETYTVLSFVKDDKTIRVNSPTGEKAPKPIVYTRSGVTPVDVTGLLNKLSVTFETIRIKSYIPIVKVKEAGFIVPEGVPNIEGLTTLFDLDLAVPPDTTTTETNREPGHFYPAPQFMELGSKPTAENFEAAERYIENHNSIDPNLVSRAEIELAISKTKVDKLPQQERNLGLYYKKGNTWLQVPLRCIEIATEYICSATFNDFSNNFAISKLTAAQTPSSLSELQSELMPFIRQKAEEKGVDPSLVISIVKIETGNTWDPYAVSHCGAAGLMQIMPTTGKGLGLRVLDPVTDPRTGQGVQFTSGCDRNYGAALDRFRSATPTTQLALYDERFNERKAVVAAIDYIVYIKKILARRGIPLTVENIAAGYNAGPGRAGVIDDNNYCCNETRAYATTARRYYNELQAAS